MLHRAPAFIGGFAVVSIIVLLPGFGHEAGPSGPKAECT
jgi:hypothetical protein